MKEIKFCENNFGYETENVVNKLKETLKDTKVEVSPCLGHCGECANGPFALINDTFISADTAETLYNKIMNRLKS